MQLNYLQVQSLKEYCQLKSTSNVTSYFTGKYLEQNRFKNSFLEAYHFTDIQGWRYWNKDRTSTRQHQLSTLTDNNYNYNYVKQCILVRPSTDDGLCNKIHSCMVPKEFEELCNPLDCYNEAFHENQLSISQRRGIIFLIPKSEERDLNEITCWPVADPVFELRRGPASILLAQPSFLPSAISSNKEGGGWGGGACPPRPLPKIRHCWRPITILNADYKFSLE